MRRWIWCFARCSGVVAAFASALRVVHGPSATCPLKQRCSFNHLALSFLTTFTPTHPPTTPPQVHRCVELFTPYLKDLNSSAKIVYTGHTALDPTTAPPPPAPALKQAPCRGAFCKQRPRPAAAPPLPQRPDFGAALHVRGKSELKHTAELLECWSRHKEWPKLTVVGCVEWLRFGGLHSWV